MTYGEEKDIISEPYIVFDVETLVKTGQNTVVMTCYAGEQYWSDMMPFVMLSGDFLLDGKNMLTPIDGTIPCRGFWTEVKTHYRTYTESTC